MFIAIPRAQVEKHRRKVEQDALADARRNFRRIVDGLPRRSHHGHNESQQRKLERETTWLTKPFIMWDGEGPQDAGYALFGNSVGDEICHPYLSTIECLDLILESATNNPGAINIAFGFNYDVSMILKDLPHRHLRALHAFTKTIWKGYQIEHIPHKWFKVKHGELSCKIYDVRSFFAGDYISALQDFGIGTTAEREAIAKGKSDRATFLWSEISEIKDYWRLELKLGPMLMEHMRKLFYDAGYVPRSWHGPGALARMALKRHKVYEAMAVTPVDVRLAAQYAFAGGRFEPFQAGHIQGKVYNADIHSAYPAFATQLPNLARGKWRRTRHYEPGKFGVYHIRYNAKPNNSRCFPLFRRLANGSVVWPHQTEGWYWQPEAELVKDDPDAKILEGWVFDEDNVNDRPFAWLAEYYYKRKRLKDAGSEAEYTFKIIINAVYGQLAQRAGWNRKNRTAPKSHQLEWAGYITSACRAAVYTAAIRCGEKLVSIDTDGIYATAPITGIDVGPNLGQWETAEYEDGIFWQSGIYCLKTENGWVKARSRGIRKGSYDDTDLITALYFDEPLKLNRRVFVTYGLADQIGWDKHNTWIDEPHEYVMGGNGKRFHAERACKNYCQPPMHRLVQWSPMYGVHADSDPWSVRHKLPWIEPRETNQNVIQDFEFFDANHLADDDLWVLQ